MSLPYYQVIKGEFVIIGKEPDGDSIRFIAEAPKFYRPLQFAYRIYKELNKNDGSVQLRFEGVDAPELHYGTAAQPLGVEVRGRLLECMGFKDIKFDPQEPNRVTNCKPERIPGAILSKASEVNGRPISYVLLEADSRHLTDGTAVYVDQTMLEKTINLKLLREGCGYYTVYTSTPWEHRQYLRQVALEARQNEKGIWQSDATSSFILESDESIGPNGALILPKLFRRSIGYLKGVAKGFQGNLAEWMGATSTRGARTENDLVVINEERELPLSSLIIQNNRTIVFQPDLLDLMFVEK